MGQLRDGTKTITTAGTRERLVNESTIATWLICERNPNNTGDVVIGGETVVAAAATRRGIKLPENTTKDFYIVPPLGGPLDLYDVWVDATQDGDKLHFLYMR